MTYKKHEWETKEVITAQNLNHIQNGISNITNFLIVKEVNEYLNKTAEEIINYLPFVILIKQSDNKKIINKIGIYQFDPAEETDHYHFISFSYDHYVAENLQDFPRGEVK